MRVTCTVHFPCISRAFPVHFPCISRAFPLLPDVSESKREAVEILRLSRFLDLPATHIAERTLARDRTNLGPHARYLHCAFPVHFP